MKYPVVIVVFFLSSVVMAQTPTASFSIPQGTVCAGVPVQVTDLSSNATSYTFMVDNVPVYSIGNPVITFSADGYHTLELIVSNSAGSDNYSLPVYVNPLPVVGTGPQSTVSVQFPNGSTNGWSPLVFNFSDPLPPGAVLSGMTLTFSASDQGWGGTGASAGFQAGGSYLGSVVLLATVQNFTLERMGPFPNYSYGGSNSFEMYFVGWPGWVGYLYNARIILHYHTNELPQTICAGSSVTLKGAGALSYTWSPQAPDGIPFIPASSAIFTVTGESALGCVNSMTQQITLSSPVITAAAGTICPGQGFLIQPSGAVSYSVSGGSFSVNPQQTTTYSVSGTDTLGCVSALPAEVEVTVIPLPVVSAADASICAGGDFLLQPAGAHSYSFSGGAALQTIHTTQTFTITGYNSLGCAGQDVTVQVTALPLPTITVAGGTICAGESFVISPAGAASYTYSSVNPVVTPAVTTSYTVTGSNASGCVAGAGLQVVVEECTGMARYSGAALKICPNPSQGVFILNGVQGDNYEVYDTGGRLVASGKLPVAGSALDLGVLPAGIYHFITSSGSGKGIRLVIVR